MRASLSFVLTLFFSLFVIAPLAAQTPPPICTNSLPVIDVPFIFAPESTYYNNPGGIIDQFHQKTCFTAQPENPLPGGGPLPYNIRIMGVSGNSGEVATQITKAIREPGETSFVVPLLWQPSIIRWLQIVNQRTGRTVYQIDENLITTTREPSIIAIWESYYDALVRQYGKNIGWRQLLAISQDPRGWTALGINNPNRPFAVFFGQTNPEISSTALDTLIALYHLAAGVTSGLNLSQVANPTTQAIVQQFQNMARHYADTTVTFRDYLFLGPDYIDFVALDENTVIRLNRFGFNGKLLPQRLVAIYPQDGALLQDRPLASPAPNVISTSYTPDHYTAARIFSEFVVTEPIQRLIMNEGFRPAISIPLDPAIWSSCQSQPPYQYGVTDCIPNTLTPPTDDVVDAIQKSWSAVRRPADVIILMDISRSMLDPASNSQQTRLQVAQEAAAALITDLQQSNPNANIRLITFNKDVKADYADWGPVSLVGQNVINSINNVRLNTNPDGDTNLYGGVIEAVNQLNQRSDSAIQAIILLSDGANTFGHPVLGQQGHKQAMLDAIIASWQTKNPIFVLPVAFDVGGNQTILDTLKEIGEKSFIVYTDPSTNIQKRYFEADGSNLAEVLRQLSRYF